MKRWAITFSGAAYDIPTSRMVEATPRCGVDELLVYDDVWLEESDFKQTNKWLWEHPGMRLTDGSYIKRGARCWYAFKPLILLETFKRMSDGDVVLYMDGDTYPIRDLSIVYDIAARDGAMLFSAVWHRNAKWCKRDCFIAMGQDEYWTKDQQAGVARYCAFKKGPWKPYQFLMEWLTYSVNLTATTFDPSKYGPECPEFEEHRTEQAIMTLLAHKHGYTLYREACQYGEPHYQHRDLYGQLFQVIDSTVMGAPAEGSRWRNV